MRIVTGLEEEHALVAPEVAPGGAPQQVCEIGDGLASFQSALHHTMSRMADYSGRRVLRWDNSFDQVVHSPLFWVNLLLNLAQQSRRTGVRFANHYPL